MRSEIRYEFDLPEDKYDFEIINSAHKHRDIVHEFREYLFGIEELETKPTIEQIAEKFFKILDDYNYNTDI